MINSEVSPMQYGRSGWPDVRMCVRKCMRECELVGVLVGFSPRYKDVCFIKCKSNKIIIRL